MVKINLFDRVRAPNKIKSENKSFEDIKKSLEELHEHSIIFEELEKSSLFEAENSIYIKNDAPIQIKSLISEIKEKQEITDRLHSLSYSIKWLMAAILRKDNHIISKAISSITKNEYSSINTIIPELKSLKNKIEKFENLHTDMLDSNLLSLDIKILLEQDFKEKHKKLNELYNKQKNILLNLSSIFVKLTKHHVIKKNK